MPAKKNSTTIQKDDLVRFPVPEISENSITILEKRYLKKDLKTRKSVEDPRDLFIRVAKAIAHGSSLAQKGVDKSEIADLEERFYKLMTEKDFLPNSPTLMNAGRELPNLSACFVLPIEDSMEGIFDTVKNAALIHKSGGGTGFDFSELRPAGSKVKTTAGTASGPISFMSVFNSATETIKQGGVRRGANMGILRVDHPDIIDFICCKEDTTKLTNFNISVAITNEFMQAYKNNSDYNLYDFDGSIHSTESAKRVMDMIVHQAWLTGEPGLIFIDKVNQGSTIPGAGKISATNPCGEQPLLPYEACNLGSINVSNFYVEESNSIDWERLKEVIFTSILFLDNVIEIGQYPLEKIHETVKNNRKIGLGVMGFADLLYKLGIPYNSAEGINTGKKLMAFIQEYSHDASHELAKERSVFPNFDKSSFKRPMRNGAVTTIAPTGTIGMLAETSGGIEPNFALVYVKQVMDNEKLLYVNPIFEEALKDRGVYSKELMEKIADHGKISDMNEIPEDIKKIFVTAQEIEPEYHVAMQSAFQENVDASISKTINFDNSASEEDIKKAYLQAFDSACKGITVYRDGCRQFQVLNVGNKTNEDRKSEENIKVEPEDSHKPKMRPDILVGKTYKIHTGEGTMYVTVNEIDNEPFEIFASIGKAGGNAAAQSEAVSRLVSLALRADIPLDVIVKQLIGIGSPTPVWHNGEQILSTPDAIGKVLKRYIDGSNDDFDQDDMSKVSVADEIETDKKILCPKCNGVLRMQEGCMTCHTCGYSKCG